jgi:hypothetical protein
VEGRGVEQLRERCREPSGRARATQRDRIRSGGAGSQEAQVARYRETRC